MSEGDEQGEGGCTGRLESTHACKEVEVLGAVGMQVLAVVEEELVHTAQK